MGSVRFHIQNFLKITSWTRSSALIGPEGTLLVFLFQAPFTKIDGHRSGIRPSPTGTDETHTTQGQDIHNFNCGNALRALWLIFLRCAPLCTNRRLLRTPFDQQTGSRGSNIYIEMASVPREVLRQKKDCRFCLGFPRLPRRMQGDLLEALQNAGRPPLPSLHMKMRGSLHAVVQPFSQKPRTPTVAPLSQIGLCDPVKADL